MHAALLRVLLIAVALTCAVTPLGAHDDTAKPIVTLNIERRGTAMTVRAHLPVVALMDANLPRTEDRALDLEHIAGPLQLVARDLATRLAFAQNNEPLPFPVTSAVVSPDQSAVEATLGYVIQAGDAPLSARLQTFRSIPDSIAVQANYSDASGQRSFIVSGAPELIVFNPTLAQVARQFVSRGARLVANSWTPLLFLLVAAFALAGQLPSLLITLLICEALGMAAGALLPLSGAAQSAASGLAASVVVIAALVGMTSGHPRHLRALSAAFGLFSGTATGLAFTAVHNYAGAHPTVALITLTFTLAFAQAWLLILFSTARDAVQRTGVPARAVAIALLVYACHSALHLLSDDAEQVSLMSRFTFDHLMAALILAWLAVTLVVSIAGHRKAVAA